MVSTKFMFLFGMVLCSVGFVLVDEVHASVKSQDDIYRLSTYLNARECYNTYAKDEVPSLEPGAYFDYKTVFDQKNKKKDYSFGDESAKSVYIPTYVGSGFTPVKADNNKKREEDSDFSCLQVFDGWGSTKGLKQLSDKFPPDGYLGMGYEAVKSGDGWVVTVSDGEGYTSSSTSNSSLILTFDEESDGYGNRLKTCEGSIEIKVGTYLYKLACEKQGGKGNEIAMMKDGNAKEDFGEALPGNGWKAVKGDLCPKAENSGKSNTECGELNADNVKELVRRLIKGEGAFLQDGYEATQGLEVLGTYLKEIGFDKINVRNGSGEVVSGYKLPAGNDGASKAAGKMLFELGVNSSLPNRVNGDYVEYTWNDAYKYSLYYYYIVSLESLYKGSIQIGGEGKCGDSADGMEYAFRNAEASSEDKPAWCEISIVGDKKDEILNAFVSIPTNGGMKKGTFKEVIKSNAINYSNMNANEYAELSLNNEHLNIGTADVEQPSADNSGGGGSNASGDTAVTCQNSVGAVGWAICPVLDWMGNASTELYSTYVEPRLKINPKLFQNLDGTTKNPTRDAWGTFQTIANVIFIILLLIVIFSQLTGVGIDNYGIKRILPKLIVVAILVNLSYLICVICVDLSNILGGSLKGLFDGLGASLGDIGIDTGVASTSALGNDSWLPMILTGILVTTVIVGSVSIIMNPALILTLFISVIGVAISVLFVFVLFAMRQAAIVVLTVAAPIAFVCYALPNTKKIFDKWLKAWQGLLLVYPICGLLIGGGDYVSRLILVVEKSTAGQDGNWFVIITAMVIGVVPIFFLPMILKGSFAAMGNIGAKVAGIGKALGGRATGMARNSELNKKAQQRGVEHQTRFRAGVDMHGNELKMGRFRRLIRGGSRSIAQAREQYTRDQNAAARRESLTSGIGFSAALVSQRKAAERDTLSDYMTWINNETKNGEDEGRLNDLYRQYMNSGEKAGAVAVARIAGRRKDTAKRFMENHIANGESSSYNKGMVDSVMKEVSTGENSGNFRESTPMGFEYASQVNRGAVGTDGSGNLMNYNDWKLQKNEAGSYSNVHDAIDHHITNTKSLVGATKGSLTELADMIENGQIDERDANTLRTLANEAIENRGRTGIWDESKADVINRIAGSASSSSVPTSTTPPDTPPATPVAPATPATPDAPATPAAPPVATTTHTPVQARTDGSVASENRRILFQNNGVTGFENRLSDRLLERAINESNEASHDDSSRIDINHDRNGGANGDV